MNIAIILAGGSGKRTGQIVPKQFLTVNDKPILIYTLENFENNPNIDEIICVCIEGWEQVLEAYAGQFNINKLKHIVKSGNTAQESIFNGVKIANQLYPSDTCVVIHDGIRPLVDERVLNDVIEICQKYGNGVTSLPYNEQIFIVKDEKSTEKYIPRETLRRISTPQAYKLSKLFDCYEKAKKTGVGFSSSSYTNTMMVDLGETLYLAKGSDKNIKLTTKDDLQIFMGFIQGGETGYLK